MIRHTSCGEFVSVSHTDALVNPIRYCLIGQIDSGVELSSVDVRSESTPENG